MLWKRKVLVVDDQDLNRQILSRLLNQEYEVLTASDGKQAMEVMKENKDRLSAILLDIIMPVMSGYDVLAEMQKDATLARIPVIVTTQEEGEQSEVKALAEGAADFVTKPYKPEVIRHRLRNLIKMREASETVDIVEKDILTGLLNKEAFYHKAAEVLLSNAKNDYDVIAVDIERFKLINDTYGVAEGDKLLKYLAKLINDQVQVNNGICGRLNGDQFIILCRRNTDALEGFIGYILNDIAAYPLSMKIQVKFGIYQVEDKTLPVISMGDRAVLAVNETKGKFDAFYSYYDDSIRERMLLEQTIINEMAEALSEGQFDVYLQGKYDLSSERIAGAEALVRWIHPTMGFMSPGDFIPIFERNGFITHLDMYVWDKTSEIIAGWLASGDKYVPVSVNVSRKDIYNVDLPQILLRIIEKHGIKPYHLHLEITETAYTENPEQLIDVVNELKDLGFIIEMDDFGSGYSSLNMISELPIDILKLDLKFLQNAKSQSDLKNILSFIFNLAKWMDLPVVAEGVETIEQIDLLKGFNCSYVQGYYFSKPIPNQEFTELLMQSDISYMMNPYDLEVSEDDIVIGPRVSDETMLIVDDMKMNRELLREYFEDKYTVVEASSAESAWSYLMEHHKDIVIIMLDLIMPVLDGYEFMKRVHDDEYCKNIPIVVTSQAGESEEAKALSAGAADYISKPYSKDVAVQRVSNVLNYTKLLQKHANGAAAKATEE